MELLDRYLQAVEFWLPRRQKKDIIAELSEDLGSQIEEKESELGRKLNDGEVEAILKRCGPPLRVALRYRPQQYLIGPALFPIYKFVLAVLLAGCIIPRFLIWLVFLLVDPAHRGYLHMENLWATVIFFAFFTTLTFAIMEKSGVDLSNLNTWNPRKLPPVRDPNRIPLASSLFEIGGMTVTEVWFISTLWPGTAIDLYWVQLAMAPVWHFIFWSVVFVNAAQILCGVLNALHPVWTRGRAVLQLVLHALGGAVFCWFLKARVLTGIQAPRISAAKGIQLADFLNTGMARALPWAVIVILVVVSVDVYRIVRIGRLKRQHGDGGSIARGVEGIANPVVGGD
jgi:hypothetical protein